MTENLDIWKALEKTDPAHTKPFKRGGGFSGTSIKPIYMTRKMTEQFGPCGKGWGMNEPQFTIQEKGDDTLVFCTVGLWWEKTEQVIYGVGGDKVAGTNKYGQFTDDEAFKKSYTDALSNAMKQIGVGADVHMGMHDDDKYVRHLRDEIKEVPAAPADVYVEAALKVIGTMQNVEGLTQWWENEKEHRANNNLTHAHVKVLKDANIKRRDELEKAAA